MSHDPAGTVFDWTKFWAGAVATAVVAALIAIVGELVCETLINVDLLPAGDRGVLGWSDQVSYPVGAAALALVCAAVLNLFLLGVPRPLTFFGWVMSLVGVIVVVAPFNGEAETSVQVATALVGLVVVIAIGSLLTGSARRAASRRVI